MCSRVRCCSGRTSSNTTPCACSTATGTGCRASTTTSKAPPRSSWPEFRRRLAGRTHVIGQANNAFVFPGIGLGAIVAEVLEVSDELFLVAADTLSDAVTASRLRQGGLYPSQSELRAVSKQIAIRVVRAARDGGIGRALRDEQIEDTVDAAMWFPTYAAYHPLRVVGT